MALSENQNNNRVQIRTLLLIAIPVYLFFGFFILRALNAETFYFFRYIGVTLFHLTFVGLLFWKRLNVFFLLPSILTVIVNVLVVANSIFLPAAYCESPIYLLGVAIILTAVIDTTSLLDRKFTYLHLVLIGAVFAIQVFRTDYLQNLSIVAPLSALILWQCAMVLKVTKIFDEVIQNRQLAAYRSTIVMLNHEFNNVSAICLMLSNKIKRQQEKSVAPDQKDLERFNDAVMRLSELVKKTKELGTYEEVSYLGHGMTKIS